jgi:hypothetical protein
MDANLAGMWRNCLIRQLARQRNDFILKDLLQEPYRSPGWLWALSRGRILFYKVLQEDARFVACDVIPVDKKSPFGRIENGKLTLRAAIKPIPPSLDVRSSSMDLGQRVRRTVDQDSWLLFLGYRARGHGTCLIITPDSDGSYLRIEATMMKGTEMDLW